MCPFTPFTHITAFLILTKQAFMFGYRVIFLYEVRLCAILGWKTLIRDDSGYINSEIISAFSPM